MISSHGHCFLSNSIDFFMNLFLHVISFGLNELLAKPPYRLVHWDTIVRYVSLLFTLQLEYELFFLIIIIIIIKKLLHFSILSTIYELTFSSRLNRRKHFFFDIFRHYQCSRCTWCWRLCRWSRFQRWSRSTRFSGKEFLWWKSNQLCWNFLFSFLFSRVFLVSKVSKEKEVT